MKDKIRINEVLIVEGKYDAAALAGVVEGLILTTDGFSVFSDTEKKELIRELGKKRGIVVLTDSDAAGFQIRHYIEKIARGCSVKHAYIPAVEGKERRKAAPSKEGTLGVEGLPPSVLAAALERAGVAGQELKKGRQIDYTDLYQLGLSGTEGSSEKRRVFLKKVGLPQRLSKKALCEVLSTLYTYDELLQILEGKPVLFWDFHGTLSLPEVQWFDAAMEAAAEAAPETPLSKERLLDNFSAACLPWYTLQNKDSRHVSGSRAWWNYCENEFAAMFQKCGFSAEQAEKIAPRLRRKMLNPEWYHLYPDVIDTLGKLQQRGYKNYVASNNFPELAQLLDKLGLTPYFSGIFSSGEIGYEKPHSEFFEALREGSGFPGQVWMIGDNPVDDIQGANQAGFTTVAVHGVQAPEADYQLDELAELLEILR